MACSLKTEEIGQIYGISRMAVSKRLKKLHKKLDTCLENLEELRRTVETLKMILERLAP